MKPLKSFLTDLFTTHDGVSWDLGRVLWAVACLQFTALGAWAIIHNHQPFDAVAMGTGGAAILAGGGIGLAAKLKTEAK